MTHGERLLVKLLLWLVPITIIYCLIFTQQDIWQEIKTQKANNALAALVERTNSEADARHSEPQPVRLYRNGQEIGKNWTDEEINQATAYLYDPKFINN